MAAIYGQLVKAQLENLAADIASPPNGIVYFNTVSLLPKFYDSASWRTLVATDTTQTLSAKTLLTPVLDDYIDINQESAPGSPAAGKLRLYVKNDDKIYKKTSAGVETEVGASGGATATATVAGVVTSYAPLVQSAVKAAGDANYTILDSDGYDIVTVAPTSTARTITLPAAANNIGRRITVVNIGALTVNTDTVVARAGSDVIYNGFNLTATTVPVQRTSNRKTLVALASGIWLVEEAGSEVYAFALDGGFSAGTCYLVRTGNNVTVAVLNATWSSASIITSTAVIPDGLRPEVTSNRAIIASYPATDGVNQSLTLSIRNTGAIRVETHLAGSATNTTEAGAALYGCYLIRN